MDKVRPLKQGIQLRGDTASYAWAVLDREKLEADLGSFTNDADVVADYLGWPGEYYGGPGRRFSEAPVVRSYGKKLLVTQRCGLDV